MVCKWERCAKDKRILTLNNSSFSFFFLSTLSFSFFTLSLSQIPKLEIVVLMNLKYFDESFDSANYDHKVLIIIIIQNWSIVHLWSWKETILERNQMERKNEESRDREREREREREKKIERERERKKRERGRKRERNQIKKKEWKNWPKRHLSIWNQNFVNFLSFTLWLITIWD